MDHWPIPARPVRPRTKVKVFCDEDWPLGRVDFHTYPESQGWWKAEGGDEDFITPGDRPLQRPSYANKAGANQFLQYWAYFGLLSEVIQRPIGRIVDNPPAEGPWADPLGWLSSFVFTPPQRPLPVMDSSDFPILLQDFIRTTRIEHPGDYEREGRAWACIQTAKTWLKRMQEYETPPFDIDLIMSVETLISDLTRSIHLAYEMTAHPPLGEANMTYMHQRHPKAPLIFDSMSSAIFRRRMLEDGWCPSTVKRIFTKATDRSSQYFLSMLDRPRPHLRHDEGCNDNYCRHWKVDMETYTTAHVCDGGDCRWVTVPLKRLEEILASGDDTVPVIVPGVTDTAEDGRIVVRLEAGSKETEYVAISHVWSDGLGNPTANDIPICQFERLSKMVQDACGDAKMCFWLDTLCFPYPTSPDKEAYQQALEKMRMTYEEAELVLVLDSYLLSTQYDVSMTDDHELALRVLCSEWSARLWTYQENRLAKRLKFIFGSTAVDIPFAILDNPILANDDIWRPFQSNRVVRPASLVGKYSREKVADLRKVYAELSYRATSVAEDEGLCLANLMGIDPRLVTRASPEGRMEHVWRHADPVDAFRTLFWPCRRLEGVNGLGWAPKSLLTREYASLSSLILSGSQLSTVLVRGSTSTVKQTAVRAKLDPEGLMFKCFYAFLSGLTRPICRRFICGGNGMDWYRVDLAYDFEGRPANSAATSGFPLPMPPSLGPLGSEDALFLLFPQMQEDAQLPSESMAVLCHVNLKSVRQAPPQHGWQYSTLYEVQHLGMARVSRWSSFDDKNRVTVYNPVDRPGGKTYYLWEQILPQNGRGAYTAWWRAKLNCDATPEEMARMRESMPRSDDPETMPPQRLVPGEPAPQNAVFLMR